jgi:hypothetical protein
MLDPHNRGVAPQSDTLPATSKAPKLIRFFQTASMVRGPSTAARQS